MATDPPPTEEIRGAYFRQAAGRPSGTVAPIVLPFMVTLAALFAVAVASMLILSAVRAYVGGEGLYSKGQRDAVYYLSRYATSRSEADFGRYRDAVAVPLGDREAREALQRRPRDLEHAQRGFLAGGNNPSDVDGMVRLFEVFEHVAQMRTAIDLWTVADRYTSKLVAIGDRLHDRPVDVPLEGRELTVVLAELDAINRQMAPLEADFSATLGHAARQLTTALILALALASMALALFGIRSAMLSREAERRQDARFRALIEHSNDMIAVVSETGAFSYLSPSWAADLGWPEGGAPHSLFDLVHDSDADGLRRSLADVHVKRHRASGRLRLRHIDGRWLTISWSARDATDVAGIGGLIINASDVTSEVALADQLQQARKMEAIGQLAGGIAHDFNNIIAAIMGFADLLAKKLPAGSVPHGWATRIIAAATRARDLVQQILAFARRGRIERAPTDLVRVVGEAADFLRASLPSSTEFALETYPRRLIANVNASQITQLVINLAVNANDALHGQPGRVSVAISLASPSDPEVAALREGLRRSDESTAVSGEMNPTKSYACITVTDSGSGMDTETLRKVFTPFFTTKQRGRGTGLGLAVVHGIIGEYAGVCVIESTPGSGTRCRVFVPLDPEPILPAVAEANVPTLTGHERLLVVDDEMLLTEVLQVGLGELGYVVTVFNDPVAAVVAFTQNPSAFDAVVTDQVMPRLTGLGLLRQLRASRSDVPVIVCTGFTDPPIEEQIRAEGIIALLDKPASVEVVAACIRAHFARRR